MNGYNHVNTTPIAARGVWHEADPEGWGAEYYGMPNKPSGSRVGVASREVSGPNLAADPNAKLAAAQGHRDVPNISRPPGLKLPKLPLKFPKLPQSLGTRELPTFGKTKGKTSNLPSVSRTGMK